VNRPSDRLVRRDSGSEVVSIPRASDRVIANVERPVAVALALVAPGAPAPGIAALVPSNLSIPLVAGSSSPRPAIVLSSDVARQDTGPILLALMTLSAGAVAVRRRTAA
jgi:hypothetical protein